MNKDTLPIENYILDKRKQVDDTLENIIPKKYDNKIERAVRYVLTAGGNRWRPILTISLAEEFNLPYRQENINGLSCVSECVHAASLILDDLPSMDNADFRRGRPTCHKKYGVATAELAAVTLVNKSWETINEYSPDRYRKVLLGESGKVGRGMVEGQLSDLGQEFVGNVSNVLRMYADKSGDLFYLASYFGLFHTDIPKESIHNFGRNMGIAYQIADDLQDVLGNRKDIGKDTGQDVNKKTILNLVGIDDAISIAEEYKEKTIDFIRGYDRLERLINRIVKIN